MTAAAPHLEPGPVTGGVTGPMTGGATGPATGPATDTMRTIARSTLRRPVGRDGGATAASFADARSRVSAGPTHALSAARDLASRIVHRAARDFGRCAAAQRAESETVGRVGPWQPAGCREPEVSWLVTVARHAGRDCATDAARAGLAQVCAPRGRTGLPCHRDHDTAAARALTRRRGARRDPAAPSPIAACATRRHQAQGARP